MLTMSQPAIRSLQTPPTRMDPQQSYYLNHLGSMPPYQQIPESMSHNPHLRHQVDHYDARPTQSPAAPPSANISSSSYSYSASRPAEPVYDLEVIQQPIQARAMGWGSKADSRRPVDPPPVINFAIRNGFNENITHQVTSNFVLHVSLQEIDSDSSRKDPRSSNASNRLAGTTMASLTHLRNPSPGKFYFLLHDLSIRQEGKYQLVFNLFEVLPEHNCVKYRTHTTSNVFTVYSPKSFPGLETSSDLIKQIASQGCRVRVRKESTFKRKRNLKKFDQTVHNSSLHLEQVARSMSGVPSRLQYMPQHQYPQSTQIPMTQPVPQSTFYPPAPAMEHSYSDTIASHGSAYPAQFEDYRPKQAAGVAAGSEYSSPTSYFKPLAHQTSYDNFLNHGAGPQGPGAHMGAGMEYSHTLPPTPSAIYDRDRVLSTSSTSSMQAYSPVSAMTVDRLAHQQRSLSYPNVMYSSLANAAASAHGLGGPQYHPGSTAMHRGPSSGAQALSPPTPGTPSEEHKLLQQEQQHHQHHQQTHHSDHYGAMGHAGDHSRPTSISSRSGSVSTATAAAPVVNAPPGPGPGVPVGPPAGHGGPGAESAAASGAGFQYTPHQVAAANEGSYLLQGSQYGSNRSPQDALTTPILANADTAAEDYETQPGY